MMIMSYLRLKKKKSKKITYIEILNLIVQIYNQIDVLYLILNFYFDFFSQ
jgi:hypothetical protein